MHWPYRILNKTNFGWCLVIIAIAAVPSLYLLDFIEAKPVTVDFSKDHLVSQIPLKNLAWVGDSKAWSDVYVSLRFPGVISYAGQVELLAFDRQGAKIQNVHLNLYPGTPEQVFNQAMTLTHRWNLPTAHLEKWHDNVKQYGLQSQDFPLAERHDSSPAISVEVHGSFEYWKPVFITVDFTWLEDLTLPTTRQSPAHDLPDIPSPLSPALTNP